MTFLTILLLISSVIAGSMITEFVSIKKKKLQLLLTFSGGYLLAISCLHLIPEIFTDTNTNNIGFFILAGFLIQILLEHFSKGIEHGHSHKSNSIPISVLISLCLHAFLEGIPLGGCLHNHAHNSLLAGIVLHKLPVSVVLMTFFLESNMPKKKAYLLLVLFSLMSPIGVWIGNLSTGLLNYQNEIMAIVIGIFLHISTTILFESNDEHKFSVEKILALIIGAGIVSLSL